MSVKDGETCEQNMGSSAAEHTPLPFTPFPCTSYTFLPILHHSHPRSASHDNTSPPPLSPSPPLPSPCWDARLVWSAPPLPYVSAMVVSIGRRSNDSACLPLCTFPRRCTPDEETLLTLNRVSESLWSVSSRYVPLKVSTHVQTGVFVFSETIEPVYILIWAD